jgi:5-methylcytosine-specific restriction protein A
MKKPKVYKPPTSSNKKFSKPRMYDTVEWVEYRNKFLSLNPKCYCCGKVARVVDHCVAHKGSKDVFWNETNYLPLCKLCHDTITGKFDQHNPPKTEEKMRWIADSRLLNNVSVRVKVLQIKLKVQIYDDIPIEQN